MKFVISPDRLRRARNSPFHMVVFEVCQSELIRVVIDPRTIDPFKSEKIGVRCDHKVRVAPIINKLLPRNQIIGAYLSLAIKSGHIIQGPCFHHVSGKILRKIFEIQVGKSSPAKFVRITCSEVVFDAVLFPQGVEPILIISDVDNSLPMIDFLLVISEF